MKRETRADAVMFVARTRIMSQLTTASDEYVEALAAVVADWAADIVEESNARSARKLTDRLPDQHHWDSLGHVQCSACGAHHEDVSHTAAEFDCSGCGATLRHEGDDIDNAGRGVWQWVVVTYDREGFRR